MNQIRIHPHPWGLGVDPRMEYQSLSLTPKETKIGAKMTHWGRVLCARFNYPSICCLHPWCSQGNISTSDSPSWKPTYQFPFLLPWLILCLFHSLFSPGVPCSLYVLLMCVYLWYSPVFVQSLFSSLGHSLEPGIPDLRFGMLVGHRLLLRPTFPSWAPTTGSPWPLTSCLSVYHRSFQTYSCLAKRNISKWWKEAFKIHLLDNQGKTYSRVFLGTDSSRCTCVQSLINVCCFFFLQA